MSIVPGIDVIILAGGRGERMGGRDKAMVSVDGDTLLDTLLDEVSLLDGLQQVAVVSSRSPEVRPGVKLVAEDPPFSGPLSALDAGVRALRAQAAAYTALLAVDAPHSAALLPDLLDALESTPRAGLAAVSTSADGIQPLCTLWHTTELWRTLDGIETTDRALKSILDGHGRIALIPGTGEERDYDTLEELRELGDVEDSGRG
ncbi:NTP transferase domain-containing protein [Corynebacterium uropygiale]|uniref:NTP transferase domain-containing protein n=1 Tax=Corynebacterium uropygiale TaxID=1775911 RepID=A0A9X1QQJ6_9CORY|nr:NTP transferase domain-containing protein [Corynebacterium uropygiale]